MKNILDKKMFYEQLKRFTNKNVPINIYMPVNNNCKYSIVLDESRTTRDDIDNNYTMQIIDRTKVGYEKYMCKDIEFNLFDEKIYSDFQLYKFVNKKIQDVLENK